MNGEVVTTSGAAWTEERVDLLKKLWSEGLSASQIAGRLGQGVSRNAVIGKVHRLGLAGRAPSTRTATPRTSKIADAVRGTARNGSAPTLAGSAALKTAYRPAPLARAIPLVEPKPLILLDLPKGGHITILQLSDKTCRWPIGDPGTEGFCFCGHGPKVNSVYCEYHYERAYQPPPERRPRREGPPVFG
jgi:GcrA cell cycle regulator